MYRPLGHHQANTCSMRHKSEIQKRLACVDYFVYTIREITYITPLHLDITTISTYNHQSKWIMVINIKKIMANRDQ
jgi:hypothetical protein